MYTAILTYNLYEDSGTTIRQGFKDYLVSNGFEELVDQSTFGLILGNKKMDSERAPESIIKYCTDNITTPCLVEFFIPVPEKKPAVFKRKTLIDTRTKKVK